METNKNIISKINVLSLFDGMACGMIAFKNLGIPINNYYAYEIDKYCIQTVKHNFPEIQECGDVFNADFTIYKGKIDVIIGGSPCTYWSIAKNSNDRETTASGQGWELFSQYVRALNEVKPRYFLYENNKSMSKEIRQSITNTFGFEPILINSALLSAQNRQRLYWVGELQTDGTYKQVNIELPKDKGILLKDVLNGIRVPDYGNVDKSRVVSSSYSHKGDGEGSIKTDAFPDKAEKQKFDYVAIPIQYSRKTGVKNAKDKSLVLCGSDWRGLNRNQSQNAVAIPINICKYHSTYGATGVAENAYDKNRTIYEVKNKQINIKGNWYPVNLEDGYYHIRKLTVDETKALQTIPDWYKFPVSNSQAYKMIGNGWTVDVIAHILSFMFN